MVIVGVLGLVALSVVGSIALWCGICYGLALLARWPRLRELYAYEQTFQGPTMNFSGRMGITRYRGVLIGGATADGLYLNVAFPFRLGAGPVFIPWQDIAVSDPSRGVMTTSVTFNFPRAGTALRVSEGVATKLLGWR